jgi:endonuclease YncB( thermonuclease family)
MSRQSWTMIRSNRPQGRRRPAGPVAILMLLLALGGADPGWSGAPRPSTEGRAAVQPLRPPQGAVRTLWGTVDSVALASLLVVTIPDDGSREVRLYGIEPPEQPREARGPHPGSPGQPFGAEALAYVRDLITGKQVRLEILGKDRHGRSLAIVWLGDVNVNLTLVKEGLAWVSPSVGNPRVRAELEVAEQQAQRARYGLWSLPDPEPPWQYRKRLRVPAP